MEPMPLAFASFPGGIEWIVIGLVALLLFGKRLPVVSRSLGQSLGEFKAGLAGTVESIDTPASKSAVLTGKTTEDEEPQRIQHDESHRT